MAKRRIHSAEIKYISLVPRGANRMPVIYKQDGHFDLDCLMKASDSFMEKGELLAVVYAPENADSQGDVASADVIKAMMYDAAKNGVDIDLKHDENPLTKEQAFIAESFIVQKSDPRFQGFTDYDKNPVDVTGAWGVVMKIDDPDLRKLYKEGKWNGVSMGGRANVSAEKNDDICDRVVAKLAAKLGCDKGDDEMTKEEMQELLKAQAPVIASAIAVEVAKALKPEVKTEVAAPVVKTETAKVEEAPVFKGDKTNPADLKAHRFALAKYKLAKDVDWNDEKSIEKYETALAELVKTQGGEQSAPQGQDAKASNQAAGNGSNGTQTQKSEAIDDIFKGEEENLKTGRAMAKAMNGGK